MNRIVITGSFGSGKTTVSLILSHLTGFQHLLPRTDYETGKALVNSNGDSDLFYSSFMNCLFKLSDRIQHESLAESCFISDGCLLNEVAYLKAYHEIFNRSSISVKKFKEQSMMIQSIENSVSYYFTKRYDDIIFLDKDNVLGAELSTTTHQLRILYNTHLLKMLGQSGQSFSTNQICDLELTINQIVKEKRLECKISVKEAIYKAQINLHPIHANFNMAKLN
jgi:AAA domain